MTTKELISMIDPLVNVIKVDESSPKQTDEEKAARLLLFKVLQQLLTKLP